jgi:signal transduction histidine kinase
MPADSQRTADLLAAFTPNLPGRVWIKNSGLVYVHVNDRLTRDFGIPREKWIGSTDEVLFPELARAYQRNDRAALNGGQPLQTTDLVMRNGRTEFAFVLRFPLEIEAERHLGALAIDLTSEISGLVELHRVQEQRFRNERLRALGELASGLAHDLNNTLNVATLRLGALRMKAAADLLNDIDAVRRSIGTAVERVRDVQNFARAGSEQEFRSIDLPVLVREAIEMVDLVLKAPTVFGGRITIDTDFPPSLPMVSGLTHELKHVFANLLLNARDAMSEGGAITLTARVDEAVELVISDQGPGIPPETLDKIFDPFFTTKPNGSGLGLSMARDVMRRIGGEITAHNRSGGGAEFILRFPIWKP